MQTSLVARSANCGATEELMASVTDRDPLGAPPFKQRS